MSRLPTPVIEELSATYDDGYESAEEEVYKIFANVIREMISKDKREEDDKDGKH